MRLVSKRVVLFSLVMVLIALMGCSDLLNDENEENDEDEESGLSGRWTVWDYPGPDWENHFTLVFDNTPSYSIEGRDGEVFETGPISNVTSNSFDYTIDQADHLPDIVGNTNYAEYTIDDDQLTVTFYDDETKVTAFGTLKAQRMELALIYRGEDGDGNYETWIQIYNDAFQIDAQYGDSASTATDTADYIWMVFLDDSQGIGVDTGAYTFPDGGIDVAVDATDLDISADGTNSTPDIYYDTRPASDSPFTQTDAITDATGTIGRDGELYEITLSFTFESGGTLEKYFKLPVAREYDMSGAMSVRVYSENWSDPSDITEDLELEPIVRVTPAIGGQNLFVGDDLGYVEIDSVPPGDYTIHPVFTDGAYDIEVTVSTDDEVEQTIALPRDGLYYYSINADSSVTQLGQRDVRRALAIGIDREDMISAGGGGEPAAYNLMPATLTSDGITGFDSLTESTTEATTLLSGISTFDFELLHNENTQHADIAAEFKSQSETADAIGTVTIVEKEWDAYRADVVDGTFDVARAGWILDSNNLLNYLEALLSNVDYSDDTTVQLIFEAETALDDRDLATHAARIVELHNHLLDTMVIVPIFRYE